MDFGDSNKLNKSVNEKPAVTTTTATEDHLNN